MRHRLIAARKEAKLTQQQLADLINIDRSYYAHIERGARCPSLGVALKIAQVLGKRVEEIFLPYDVPGGKGDSDSPGGGYSKCGS